LLAEATQEQSTHQQRSTEIATKINNLQSLLRLFESAGNMEVARVETQRILTKAKEGAADVAAAKQKIENALRAASAPEAQT
jgi:hypothetical protein